MISVSLLQCFYCYSYANITSITGILILVAVDVSLNDELATQCKFARCVLTSNEYYSVFAHTFHGVYLNAINCLHRVINQLAWTLLRTSLRRYFMVLWLLHSGHKRGGALLRLENKFYRILWPVSILFKGENVVYAFCFSLVLWPSADKD